MATQLIKPGILVDLSTFVRGAVTYTHDETENKREDGKHVRKWKGEVIIDDPEENDRAKSVRGDMRGLILACCSRSPLGTLICDFAREEELDGAYAEAKKLADKFNETAALTNVSILVIKGRLMTDDDETVRELSKTMQELIAEMDDGVRALDEKAIRKAANDAAAMAGMLDPKAEEFASEAIKQARKMARVITKRIKKNGEAANVVMADMQRGSIEAARVAFLDLDDQGAVAEQAPAVEANRFAGMLDEPETSEAL